MINKGNLLMPAPNHGDRMDARRDATRGLGSRSDNAGDGSPNEGGRCYIGREMGDQSYGKGEGDLATGSSSSQAETRGWLDGMFDNISVYDGLTAAATAINPVLGGLMTVGGLLGLSDIDFGDLLGEANPEAQAANAAKSRDATSSRGGGPGGPASLANQNLGLSSLPLPGSTTEPASLEALRTAADLENHFADLQRIALGQADSRAALERVGTSPEQIMFDYRESFPEFGDSMSNLSLAEIIKKFGNMSPNPTPFAEGGRVGENLTSRGDERVRDIAADDSVSTDLARFSPDAQGSYDDRDIRRSQREFFRCS